MRDYYLTPFDLEYDRLIHWDHEFPGRDALLAMKDQPHRRKIILKWNADDVVAVYRTL